MCHCKIQSDFLVGCYGITKNPQDNYCMVFGRYSEESLRKYLERNHSNLTLKERFILFHCICRSLKSIHDKNLIHGDLHSNNILMISGNCYVADLGMCNTSHNSQPLTNDDQIYGILPYIAPEVLFQKKYSKQSDIYSLGMIMWEIFAGYPPFSNCSNCNNLIVDVLNNKRPPRLHEMPPDFRELTELCWNGDPSIRPNIMKLFSFSINKLKDCYKDDIESFTQNLKSLSSQNTTGQNFTPPFRHNLQQTDSYVHSSQVISIISNTLPYFTM